MPDTDNPQSCVTVKTASVISGVPQQTLRRWADAGVVGRLVGYPSLQIMLHRGDVERLITERPITVSAQVMTGDIAVLLQPGENMGAFVSQALRAEIDRRTS